MTPSYTSLCMVKTMKSANIVKLKSELNKRTCLFNRYLEKCKHLSGQTVVICSISLRLKD